MTRGNTTQTKVHFKGKEEDFIVFVDDAAAVKKWKSRPIGPSRSGSVRV